MLLVPIFSSQSFRRAHLIFPYCTSGETPISAQTTTMVSILPVQRSRVSHLSGPVGVLRSANFSHLNGIAPLHGFLIEGPQHQGERSGGLQASYASKTLPAFVRKRAWEAAAASKSLAKGSCQVAPASEDRANQMCPSLERRAMRTSPLSNSAMVGSEPALPSAALSSPFSAKSCPCHRAEQRAGPLAADRVVGRQQHGAAFQHDAIGPAERALRDRLDRLRPRLAGVGALHREDMVGVEADLFSSTSRRPTNG